MGNYFNELRWKIIRANKSYTLTSKKMSYTIQI